MKIKTALFSLLLTIIMMVNCTPTYPQEVEVRVNYSIPAGADSAKVILWTGNDPAQCPLFEDGHWENLNLTGLTINNISPTSTSYLYTLNQPGQHIKVAIAVFGPGAPYTPLATSSFYTLPRVWKAGIISVTIVIP